MNVPSLQDAIDKAQGVVPMLWKPNSPPPVVPVVPPEYKGWASEQSAFRDNVAFFELSHHMVNCFIEGPDATRLLSHVSANNFENFEVGRAKQFVPVTDEGYIVTDGLLFRLEENAYDLVCIGAAHDWVMYHAKKGNFDVRFRVDPPSNFRQGDPVLFRYQIQGPNAPAVIERALGGPAPALKFLHFSKVQIAGRTVNAFRHGMAGQPGLEFFGEWADAEPVKQAFADAGNTVGMVNVGGLAYYTSGIESGWIPTPLPGIFTAPSLEEYRRQLSMFSYEGQAPLHGSFFSERAEDYYCSPYELGYGRAIAFNHEFIGRRALEEAKSKTHRVKVTLVWNKQDVAKVLRLDGKFFLTYAKDRVESGSKLVGVSMYAGSIGPAGTVLSLALVDEAYSKPGTELELVFGQHPGPGAAPDVIDEFPRIRVSVQTAPITEHARTAYRKD